VLLAFLNHTFTESGEPSLTEIVLLNPYTDKDTPLDKQSIFDIWAKTIEGQLINIEMQLFNKYDIEVHFMELTKLDDQTLPLEGGLINWLLFLKGANKASWEVLKMNEPTLKKAMDALEFLGQDREARRLYEERQKYLHDEASMIEWATEKGRAEEKKIIARNMLSMGLEISIIAKASGLSEADVKSLKSTP
jgi:hypothetical protein